METTERISKNTHHGHALKRIRHTLGIKQETLADMMGIDQARVSNSEQKKVLEDEVIDKFAKALNVAPELIKELEEDPVTVIIENNNYDYGHSVSGVNTFNIHNPIEQIMELCNEKQTLYERLLELEKEKYTLLEKLLKEKE